MELIQTTLSHIMFAPDGESGKLHPAILMLHGRGADEHDLFGLAQYIDPRFLVLSARAPYPFPWSGGYTWYDILEVGRPEPTMFKESYDRLVQFVEDVLLKYPIDPKRLFLFGFSMGTMMSLALLLSRPDLIAGVVANSGYVPEDTHLLFRWDELEGKQVIISHGLEDPVVPIKMGRRAGELLRQTKANVIYQEYPMGHQISEQSLADVTAWINAQAGLA